MIYTREKKEKFVHESDYTACGLVLCAIHKELLQENTGIE